MGGHAQVNELDAAIYLHAMRSFAALRAQRDRIRPEIDKRVAAIPGIRPMPTQLPQLRPRPPWSIVFRAYLERYTPLTVAALAWAVSHELPWNVFTIQRPLNDPLSGYRPQSTPWRFTERQLIGSDPRAFDLPVSQLAYQTAFAVDHQAALDDRAPEAIATAIARVLAYPADVQRAWEAAGSPVHLH
jgi:hypothetical protein